MCFPTLKYRLATTLDDNGSATYGIACSPNHEELISTIQFLKETTEGRKNVEKVELRRRLYNYSITNFMNFTNIIYNVYSFQHTLPFQVYIQSVILLFSAVFTGSSYGVLVY